MKTATSNLEEDHVYILRLIDVMEQISKEPDPDIMHLETIVDLIRNFADGLHHAKEENLLFPKMVEKGFSFQQGPIAVMMNDHVQGRIYVKGMAENISRYKSGDIDSLKNIYLNMRGYMELLRAHIAKENNILFRMADKAFSNEEQQNLLAQFSDIEETNSNDFISQINELSRIYLKEKTTS